MTDTCVSVCTCARMHTTLHASRWLVCPSTRREHSAQRLSVYMFEMLHMRRYMHARSRALARTEEQVGRGEELDVADSIQGVARDVVIV
jgi:hypothetical protein